MLKMSQLLYKPVRRGERGLTLIELLIVIALIGIVAGIGLPILLNVLTGAKTSATTDSNNGITKFVNDWAQAGYSVNYVGSADPLGEQYGGDMIAYTDVNGNKTPDVGEPVIAEIKGGSVSFNTTPGSTVPANVGNTATTTANAVCNFAGTICFTPVALGANGSICFQYTGSPDFSTLRFNALAPNASGVLSSPPYQGQCSAFSGQVASGYYGLSTSDYNNYLSADCVLSDSSGNLLGPKSVCTPSAATTTPTPTPTPTATTTGTVLFSSNFDSGSTQPTWNDTVDTQDNNGGNISSVNGTNSISPYPGASVVQMSVATGEQSHSGTSALRYSGVANDPNGSDYAYMQVFSGSTMNNPTISSTTMLSYWIYPQSQTEASSVTGTNSTCVAIDMVFGDGSDLRDSGTTSTTGLVQHPAHYCNNLTLDTWNHIVVNLGQYKSGEQIHTLTVGYDNGYHTGGYRGYLDDISIYNP